MQGLILGTSKVCQEIYTRKNLKITQIYMEDDWLVKQTLWRTCQLQQEHGKKARAGVERSSQGSSK